MEAILLSISKRLTSRIQSHLADHLGHTRWDIGLIVLAICMAILPYRHASSHPAPSMAPVYVPAAEAVTLRALPMPAPQEAQLYYPDLSKTGFSKALSVSAPAVGTHNSAVTVTMYDLVTDGNNVFQFKHLPKPDIESYSIIIFFSNEGDLYSSNTGIVQAGISKMSYAIIPSGTPNLKDYGIRGENKNTYKIILTSATFSDVPDSHNGTAPVIYDAKRYKWTAWQSGIEVFNIQWAVPLDNSSGTLLIACSEDFLTDTLSTREKIYKQYNEVRRFPIFVEETVIYDQKYTLVVDSSTNEKSIRIKGFGTIPLADIGIQEGDIEHWGVAILPPHRHKVAEFYAGYEEKIFMRVDENVIKLDRGSYVWVPRHVVHGYVAFFDRRTISSPPKQNCYICIFPQGKLEYADFVFYEDLSRMPEPKFYYQMAP